MIMLNTGQGGLSSSLKDSKTGGEGARVELHM